MATMLATPAKGKIIAVQNDLVVFAPAGTRYQLHLTAEGPAEQMPIGPLVRGIVHLRARKLWTVPSGGNFVAPIMGTPRIVQGRVREASEHSLVVHSGTDLLIDLPQDEAAVELSHGPIVAGALVNMTILPGGTFRLLAAGGGI